VEMAFRLSHSAVGSTVLHLHPYGSDKFLRSYMRGQKKDVQSFLSDRKRKYS
jgi:hypothetical protein